MKISIVIPSYNQGGYIAKTIDSILMQDDPNYEIIVIDGGSTDSTLGVVRSYGDKIHHFVSEEDEGQSDALRKGIALATGEYVGWQNSDDIYCMGAFKQFRKKVEEDVANRIQCDVYFGNQYVIDSSDRILNGKIFGPFSLDYLLYCGWNITNQSTFFKRSALHSIGGVDVGLQYAMDYDLYVRLSRRGCVFSWVNSYWGGFRLHGASKGAVLTSVRDLEYDSLRRLYLASYDPAVPFSRQFKLKRFKIYLNRLIFLISRMHVFSVFRDKFFPDRLIIIRQLKSFRLNFSP